MCASGVQKYELFEIKFNKRNIAEAKCEYYKRLPLILMQSYKRKRFCTFVEIFSERESYNPKRNRRALIVAKGYAKCVVKGELITLHER